MAVSEAMENIDETIEHVFDTAQLKDERDTAKSRRNVYEKALRAVRDAAGTEAMDELRLWIVQRIEQDGDVPRGRQVRQEGARIARDHGADVSTNDWLGA